MGASSIVSPAIGAGASLIGGGKAKKSAAKQQESALQAQKDAQIQQQLFQRQNQEWANQGNIENAHTAQGMTRENMDWANTTNRGNQEWAQGLNQGALDKQTATNRLNSTNAFGNGVTFGQDGTVTQSLGANDQGLMNNYYGKANQIMGNMGEQFGVNNDVMNALRSQLQPGFDQQSSAQRARAAAMGTGFGTGNANQLMENQIGRDFNDMNQKAVLGGQNAWLQGQQLANQQLGALGNVRQGVQSGLAQPDYAKQNAYAGVQAPTTQGWQSNIAQIGAGNVAGYDPTDAMKAGQVAGAGVQTGWNQMGQQLGGVASKGIDAWNTAGAPQQSTLAQQGAADFTNGWNPTNYG